MATKKNTENTSFTALCNAQLFAEADVDFIRGFDVIIINTSAGKDSQVMMGYVHRLAVEAGVEDRLVAVHCDLGRVEWQGTKELAEEQSAHYDIPLHIVSRPQGDLLDHVEERGMWPSSAARYCTSDHKRGQVRKLMTAITKDLLKSGIISGRRVRILNCMGIRADESPARAKKTPFEFDKSASNMTKREVYNWFPVFEWSTEDVWTYIHASGVRYHKAYDLGMKRLSCCFCVMADKNSLVIAARHNRELFNEYLAVEERIGHKFTASYGLVDLVDLVNSGETVETVAVW